jgi:hypothetical protein
VEPEHGVAREFVGPLSLALGLLFLAGIGVVVFVLLSGRRKG